jgi:hypothetical protein
VKHRQEGDKKPSRRPKNFGVLTWGLAMVMREVKQLRHVKEEELTRPTGEWAVRGKARKEPRTPLGFELQQLISSSSTTPLCLHLRRHSIHLQSYSIVNSLNALSSDVLNTTAQGP